MKSRDRTQDVISLQTGGLAIRGLPIYAIYMHRCR